jgi:hypothetical protein
MMRLAAMLLCACLMGGCSTMDVSSEKSPGADLSRYKTYAWAPEGGGRRPQSDVTDQNIRKEIDSALRKYEFPQAPAGTSPDFLVRYSVGSRETLMPDQEYMGDAHHGHVGAPTSAIVYREGSLIVDFIDAKSKTPFWRGVAEAVVETRGEALEKVPEAAQRIVKEFREDQQE